MKTDNITVAELERDYISSTEFANKNGFSKNSIRTLLSRDPSRFSGALNVLGNWYFPKNLKVAHRKSGRKEKAK